MRHILSCVRNENAKVGKTMLKQDFAEYSILIWGKHRSTSMLKGAFFDIPIDDSDF